jgi:hypothetical protein
MLPIFIITTLQLPYCGMYFLSIYMNHALPNLIKGNMLINI